MAIVEIDDVAVDGEGVADFGPVILVAGHVLGFAAVHGFGGGLRFLDRVVLEGGQGDGA